MLSTFLRAVGAALALAVAAGPLAAQTSLEAPAATAPGTVPVRHTAQVAGLWCGTGPLHSYTLEIEQHAQQVAGKLRRRERVHEITGRVEGDRVVTDPQRNESLQLQAVGDQLRVTDGTGILMILRGQIFTRAAGATCAS
jgi:hypothetical protein